MTTKPRYSHIFSLNKEQEDRFLLALAKVKHQVDILLKGIDTILKEDDKP